MLLSKNEYPWQEIYREIRHRVDASDFFPVAMQFIRRLLREQPEIFESPDQFAKSLVITEKDLRASTAGLFKLIKPIADAYKHSLDDISRLAFVYLITGETESIPLDWLGAVYTTSMLGEPVVVAMASRLSNPEEITERFTQEIHKTFGKRRARITRELRNMSVYLRKRFEGISINKLADEYIANHPSEFTKGRNTPAYRDQRARLINRLKKSMKRYQEKFLELVGDNSTT